MKCYNKTNKNSFIIKFFSQSELFSCQSHDHGIFMDIHKKIILLQHDNWHLNNRIWNFEKLLFFNSKN